MDLLITSCIALVLGPLFVSYTELSSKHFNLIRMFIAVTIVGLVVCHIVPHALADAGAIAVLMIIIGFLVPICTERIIQSELYQATHHIVNFLVLIALGFHGFIDGAALVGHETMHVDNSHDHEDSLGLGVVLHRIPLGLSLWWIGKTKFGKKFAALILIAMMFLTVLGNFWGQIWMQSISLKTIGIFQALMGGAILHIVVDDLKMNSSDIHKN